MRIERAGGWPGVPLWAVALVACQVVLVAAAHGISRGDAVLCTFRRLTGYPCPGCGTTRVGLGVLRGDIAGALAANPLVFVICAAAVLLLALRIVFRTRVVWITSRAAERYVAAAIVLTVAANWLYLLARQRSAGF